MKRLAGGFLTVAFLCTTAGAQGIDGDAKLEIWLNESVCPMGIVKMYRAPGARLMNSGDGSLVLRNYGTGGPDARSVIDENPPTPGTDAKGGVKVDVRVEKAPDKASGNKPSKGTCLQIALQKTKATERT